MLKVILFAALTVILTTIGWLMPNVMWLLGMWFGAIVSGGLTGLFMADLQRDNSLAASDLYDRSAE